MRRFLTFVALGLVIGMAGCGGSASPGQIPTDTEFMTDVKMLLDDYQQANKKAPGKLSDLEKFEPNNPGGYLKLNRGDVVYAWGVPITPGGTRVLAHKKDAAQASGPVLMEDGTVKQMTADEFNAAPKAGKK